MAALMSDSLSIQIKYSICHQSIRNDLNSLNLLDLPLHLMNFKKDYERAILSPIFYHE
jgi:hypothetical protein